MANTGNVFWKTTILDRNLSSVTQAGLVSNLNDGMAWGMWTQALGIAVTAASRGVTHYTIGAILLRAGTAMVYPTLLAAIGDVAGPSWRASAVGVYRLWRDLGYAIGAVLAGITADARAVALVGARLRGAARVAAARGTATLRRDVEFNQRGQLPIGDVTDLEAGANRCAVS